MHISRTILRTAAICALLFCVIPALPSLAHKVNVFAYTEGDKIMVETYFADGKPVENGKIVIFSSSGGKLLEGTTGKEGKASFPIPMKDDLRIEVDGSLGHKASYILKKGEM